MFGMWLAHLSPWNSPEVTLQSLSITVYLSVIGKQRQVNGQLFHALVKLTQITWNKQTYFYYYYISQITGKARKKA